jgi:GTP cyclohydrolase I
MTPPCTFDEVKIQAGVRLILEGIGEDITREGLRDTPERVTRAWKELASGLWKYDPATILSTRFASDGYDQMIVLREVDFFSLCEHHLLPFYGSATVVYIPRDRVVGLSKLARLVECYARRPQIQERMTRQIADALREHLQPQGWGVCIKARHLCMASRGVSKQRSEMVTTALGGAIADDAKAREEFLRYASV